MYIKFYWWHIHIKTHGRVSVAKKAVWRTSVLCTRNGNLQFSTPHISITTGIIYIKFINFMSSIYMTLHTNLKEISPVVYEICIHENCPIFFTFFFFIPFYKSNFWANQRHTSHGLISLKFGTPIRHLVAYLSLKFADV